MQDDEPTQYAHIEDLMQPAMDVLEARGAAGVPAGVPTGLGELDALTGGVWPGMLWAVTGRPGSGKTELALTLARNAALAGLPTTVSSRRQSAVELTLRLLSGHCLVPVHHMASGRMTDKDWARLARGMADLAAAPLSLGRGAGLVLPKQELPQRGLVVLNDVPADHHRKERLLRLKEEAERHGTAVVAVMAQAPDMDGSLVEDELAEVADMVVRVQREDQELRAGEVDLVVTHHRYGPVATIVVQGQFHYCRLVDMPTDGEVPQPPAASAGT